MDSGAQAAVHGGGGRSGGKILKRRPIPAGKTPYDRHTPPLQTQNPNWFNALVFPAKYVAGGAGKLLSSVWNPESWASSSESDSDSEGGIEDDNEQDGNIYDDGAEVNQNNASSSGKSEILYLVEQLLMLERFSREECNRLIKIINLRVADCSMREGVDSGPDNLNISNKLIMEARKMIAENPVGSSLISDLENSIQGSKSTATPNWGGSWNIQNEMKRLRSKAIELLKPNTPFSLQAPKSGNETVNVALKDMRTTQNWVPTEPCSSLPTIQEKKQIAEEKDLKDDKAGDDVILVKGNSDMITEYAEAGDEIHASQGSSNTKYPTSTYKRAATRTRKHNTKRGRPRGK